VINNRKALYPATSQIIYHGSFCHVRAAVMLQQNLDSAGWNCFIHQSIC